MKIATVFSGRADYAPLSPVIAELESRNIDVLKLDLSRAMLNDTPREVSRVLTLGMDWLAEQFEKERPDLVLLLGDRYETLGAAHIATLFQIPIAHIHGGETSEGSFDDSFRHAISQLADIHFVSAIAHGDKVIHLGANVDHVHVVGAPGLDNIVDLPPQEFKAPYFLVTYHPETKGDKSGHNAILAALEAFPEYGVVWSGVTHDPGRDSIRQAFYLGTSSMIFAGNMEPKRYLSCMKYAAACIGNSSSFLIEAPALCVPTVNVGDRQKGRLRGASVRDAASDASEVREAITFALEYVRAPSPTTSHSPTGFTWVDWFYNPYGQPGASKRIADIISSKVIHGHRADSNSVAA